MRRRPAKEATSLRGEKSYWIQQAEISESDFDWLSSAERMGLWNVRVPPRFFSRLEKLWWLDLRGGSGTNLDLVLGCKSLRYFAANQIRGLSDLSAITTLHSLWYLDLYGLRQVKNMPSCAGLSELQVARLGQMKGISSIGGILDAPRLTELEFIEMIRPSEEDVQRITVHPSLKRFSWHGLDVPNKLRGPVIERIKLERVPVRYPMDWFKAAELGGGLNYDKQDNRVTSKAHLSDSNAAARTEESLPVSYKTKRIPSRQKYEAGDFLMATAANGQPIYGRIFEVHPALGPQVGVYDSLGMLKPDLEQLSRRPLVVKITPIHRDLLQKYAWEVIGHLPISEDDLGRPRGPLQIAGFNQQLIAANLFYGLSSETVFNIEEFLNR